LSDPVFMSHLRLLLGSFSSLSDESKVNIERQDSFRSCPTRSSCILSYFSSAAVFLRASPDVPLEAAWTEPSPFLSSAARFDRSTSSLIEALSDSLCAFFFFLLCGKAEGRLDWISVGLCA
jgi:hypothetical protein